MTDEEPKFQHPDDHEFRVGEKVYVIDKNGYDIYEASIQEVKPDSTYYVVYDDYPSENGDVDVSRLLEITETNKKIYNEQEKVRKEKELEEEEEEEDEAESESETKTKAKTQEEESEKDLEEKSSSSSSEEESEEVPEKKTKSERKQKEASRKPNRQSTPRRRKKEEEKPAESVPVEHEEEEEPPSFEPEEIVLPQRELEQQNAQGLRVPFRIDFGDAQTDMSICFDRNGNANCFVYKTEKCDYLILNGIKFEIKPDTREITDHLFEQRRIETSNQRLTTSVLYPVVHLEDAVQITAPKGLEKIRLKDEKTKELEDDEELEPKQRESGKQSSRKQKKYDWSDVENSSDSE